jgi:hypothetical protein
MKPPRLILIAFTVCMIAMLNGAFSLSSAADVRAIMEPPLPALPAAGGKLIDPALGSVIMRLTDESDGSDCQVQYSYWPSFNVDSTYVQAQCSVNGRMRTKIWSFDPAGFARGPGFELRVKTPSGWPISPSDAIWSGVNPQVIFGHPVNAQTLDATNIVTGWDTVLHDFTADLPDGRTLQQMSKSIDDNVFAFSVDTASGDSDGYLVWQWSTNNILLRQSEPNVDEVQVDKTGRYLTVIHTDGSDRIWDLSADADTDLGWNRVDQGFFHHDSGHAAVIASLWPEGLYYRPLGDPRAITPLLRFPTAGQDMHFSMLADNEQWALISRYSTAGLPAQAAFENEIFQVATDGSGRVHRLAQHRSIVNSYNDTPRANISRDGHFVAFVSNWGTPNGRRDVFVLQIP